MREARRHVRLSRTAVDTRVEPNEVKERTRIEKAYSEAKERRGALRSRAWTRGVSEG